GAGFGTVRSGRSRHAALTTQTATLRAATRTPGARMSRRFSRYALAEPTALVLRSKGATLVPSNSTTAAIQKQARSPPEPQNYVGRFPDAYVEATVSGKGLRILGTSTLENFAPKFKLPNTDNGAAVELFSNSNHYLTLSCNEITSCTELPPIGDKMAAIAAELGAKPDQLDFDAAPRGDGNAAAAVESAPHRDVPATSWTFSEETRLRSALGMIPADEKALAEKFGHSHDTWVKIGRAIERLGWGERGFAIFRDW